MPVNFDNLIPKIYAMGLLQLRRRTVLPRYCLRKDEDMRAMPMNGILNIPLPSQSEAEDVIPSSQAYNPPSETPKVAPLTLNRWKRSGFTLSDADASAIMSGVMPMLMSSKIDSLARNIDQSIAANYRFAYKFVGTPGVTPFATSTVEAQNARLLLNEEGVPIENRSMILDLNADANASGLQIFQQYLMSGTTETLRTARIGEKIGFQWDHDNYMPRHVRGTLNTSPATSAATAIGATTVTMTAGTLTGTVVPGDIFSVAGDTSTYVVESLATAAGNAITVTFFPGARVAWPAGSLVTFRASHNNSFAMHREAIAFGSRPLDDVMFKGGNEIITMPDPESGLTLTMELSRQNKQTLVDFSCFWGTSIARRECLVRIAG